MFRKARISRLPIVLALASLLTAAPALAQSTAASQASAVSMGPVEVSAAFVAEALASGSTLLVTAAKPVGQTLELSVETVGHASIAGLRISAAAARAAGLTVGTTLSVTAVGGGWLISKGSEVIAFVPDRLALALTHHLEL
jgi:hypothetical protein